MRDKLILLLSLIVISSFTFANDFYVATKDLNVRFGAGTNFPVSFTLQKGDEVEILSIINDWYKIKIFDQTGYANSNYLRYSRSTSNTEIYSSDKSNYLVGAFLFVTIILVTFSIIKNRKDKKLLGTVTELNRGTKTERDLVLKLLKFGIPQEYLFHDLYLKKSKGGFAQIDLAAITDVGIIVFEVKDYSGWLYGTGAQLQWTQVLAYGKKKYRLYNPIIQNANHIKEIRKQFNQVDEIPFYSVLVFYGNCVLKDINYIPAQTFISKSERVMEVVQKILSENKPISYSNKTEIIQTFQQSANNGASEENQILHKENIKELLGKHRLFD